MEEMEIGWGKEGGSSIPPAGYIVAFIVYISSFVP